jgi:prolyl oligopeptidase
MHFLDARVRLAALPSVCLSPAMGLAVDGPPVATVRPMTDTYHGTAVVDPYRHFENLKEPEVQAWMKAQSAYARGVLDSIPGRDALLRRIHAMTHVDTRRSGFVRRGQRDFYELTAPGAHRDTPLQPRTGKSLSKKGLRGRVTCNCQRRV